MVIDLFKNVRRRNEARRQERREAHRGRTLLNGKIVYGPGFTADCCIRDLTPLGAKVMMPPNQTSPEEFFLIVVRDGLAHRSRTRWSNDREAGVTFEDTHDFAGPVPAYLQPMRRIWAELAPRP
jgi:hypothetical protein